MEQYKITVLSSIFKEIILSDLISVYDLFSLLYLSDLCPHLTCRILDRLVFMLDLSNEIPPAQQAIQHLTPLLDDPTQAVRQLASDLLCHASNNLSVSGFLADSGAIQLLFKLLNKNKDDYLAARCIESLFSNAIIAESSAASSAIEQLACYLSDPATQFSHGRLFCSVALGNLFQCKTRAMSSQAVRGVKALVRILQEGPSDDLKSVVLGALQNVAFCGNGVAVLESGGVQLALDVINSANEEATPVEVQAARLVRLVFERSDVSKYATVQAVGVLAAALEKQGENDEYLKALRALFTSLPSLTLTQDATSSIPHLVSSLCAESEAAEEAALDCLFLMMESWASARCPIEVREAQSVLASRAIPYLQMIVQAGPAEFKHKAMTLLRCLPGVLTVVVNKAGIFRQKIGKSQVYCKVKVEGFCARKTGVSAGPAPRWNEEFKWEIGGLQKDLKLEVSCKNKSLVGKGYLGKIEIRPECALLGAVHGEYALPKSKSGASRCISLELIWSAV